MMERTAAIEMLPNPGLVTEGSALMRTDERVWADV